MDNHWTQNQRSVFPISYA
ncbi:hypothetical protein [Dorea ammoniilytica]